MMNKKTDVIKTARLVLKAFENTDRAAAVDILMNDEIAKTYMVPEFDSKKEAEELFEKLKELCSADGRVMYGIYSGGELVGFINDCGVDGGAVEIGYVIHPTHRGKGYAPEALRAIIDESFRRGYTEVVCGYFEGNDASARVMKKCGMKRVAREDVIEYRGERHRCLYCAIKKTRV